MIQQPKTTRVLLVHSSDPIDRARLQRSSESFCENVLSIKHSPDRTHGTEFTLFYSRDLRRPLLHAAVLKASTEPVIAIVRFPSSVLTVLRHARFETCNNDVR